jgi:hypothetical protein
VPIRTGPSPRPQMPVRLHRAWWDDGDPVGRDAIALDRSGGFPARNMAAEPYLSRQERIFPDHRSVRWDVLQALLAGEADQRNPTDQGASPAAFPGQELLCI